MKCPFELPVKKQKQAEEGYFYKIKDAQNKMIACGLTEDEADYIVQAINSHDQFKNHFSHIDTCLMIMANTRTEEGLRDLPKLANDLRKYVRQALKEAEKE